MPVAQLEPHQVEVRSMLVIDESASPLLEPREIEATQGMGLIFGAQPEDMTDVFSILSPTTEDLMAGTNQLVYDAMVHPPNGRLPRLFFFTRRMVKTLQRQGLDVIEDIQDTIAEMERGWRDSIYCR